MQEENKNLLLLQINDALFPIGGYSHSYGLETYIQKNLVQTAEETWKYMKNKITYGFCYNEFLSAKLAYEYASKDEIEELVDLEELVEASRVPREIREAGNKLGSRFIKTVRELEIPYEKDVFIKYCEKRINQTVTHSIVYGVFCAAVGIPYESAMDHYLFAQTSAMVTNCVKTIPLSQTVGQKLLYKSHELLCEVRKKVDTLTIQELCLATPGFDIRCMQHEGLYSRIYMS